MKCCLSFLQEVKSNVLPLQGLCSRELQFLSTTRQPLLLIPSPNRYSVCMHACVGESMYKIMCVCLCNFISDHSLDKLFVHCWLSKLLPLPPPLSPFLHCRTFSVPCSESSEARPPSSSLTGSPPLSTQTTSLCWGKEL